MSFERPSEDRVAIRELLDAYSDAVSRSDADDWAATWAEDAVWSLPDYPEIGEVRGKTAIVETWKAAMAQHPGVVFVSVIAAILVDGDRASVRSWTPEVYDRNGLTRLGRGCYEDICVKQDGKWLFESRCFRKCPQPH